MSETNSTTQAQAQEQKTQRTKVEAGTYSVRPLAGGLTQTQSDPPKPQVWVNILHLEGPYKGHRDTWYGGLQSDAASEKTAETLRDCGWIGTDPRAIAFPESAKVEAVYEVDDRDSSRTRLRYLNSGARFTPRAVSEELLSTALETFGRALGRVNEKRGTVQKVEVPESARPALARLQSALTERDAAKVWIEAARGLEDEARKAVWKAIAARFSGDEVKKQIGLIGSIGAQSGPVAVQAPKPVAPATVESMPMPDNF